jgi:hypothetical protein
LTNDGIVYASGICDSTIFNWVSPDNRWVNQGNLILAKHEGSNSATGWTYFGPTSGGTTPLSMTACGFGSNSDFQIGEGCVALAGNNSLVCTGGKLNLASSNLATSTGITYSWSGPNGFTSTLQNPSINNVTTATSGAYTVTVTNSLGCSSSASTVATVSNCVANVTLKLFIGGYYTGSGQMQHVMTNELVGGATSLQTDTINIQLRSTSNPAVTIASQKPVLMTNGSATATFGGSTTGNAYWIAIFHRNAVQTWSAAPVTFSPVTTYDFSSALSQAYGSNMITEDGVWAFYNGDINQDENVDIIDFPDLSYGIINGLFGYYNTDLNGDGNVDILDFPTLNANILKGDYSFHP